MFAIYADARLAVLKLSESMKTYQEWLNEGKQVGILYHFTHLKNLLSILNDDDLIGSGVNKFSQISLTRNKNFGLINDSIAGTGVRITLDGDKISNNYKVAPYQAAGHDIFGDEQEEIVITKHLKNINKYILKVTIYKEKSIEEIKSKFKEVDKHNQEKLKKFINIDKYVEFDDVISFLKENYKNIKFEVI